MTITYSCIIVSGLHWMNFNSSSTVCSKMLFDGSRGGGGGGEAAWQASESTTPHCLLVVVAIETFTPTPAERKQNV